MASPVDRTSLRLACAVTLLMAGQAQASIPIQAGDSGAIMPVGSEGVEMIDMRIVLHASGKVKAVYTFWNATSKEVAVPVAFPVIAGSVEELRVTVDGAKVEHHEEKPACQDGEEVCPDRQHVFDVVFPPKQNVTVKCTYVQPPSHASTGHTVLGFILRTAGGWKGDVGNFNLYVTLPHHVCTPLSVAGRLPVCTDGEATCPVEKLEGFEILPEREGTIAPWESGTAFRYSVKATGKETKLNLWAQDFEPAGDISVLVPPSPGACAWDPALVTGPLEKVCRFSEVVAAKKETIEKLALELGEERIGACLGLPGYLLEGGAVFGKETYGGIDTAIIEKHHAPEEVNGIPLYLKSGLVPGLKTFEKKLKKILAQVP